VLLLAVSPLVGERVDDPQAPAAGLAGVVTEAQPAVAAVAHGDLHDLVLDGGLDLHVAAGPVLDRVRDELGRQQQRLIGDERRIRVEQAAPDGVPRTTRGARLTSEAQADRCDMGGHVRTCARPNAGAKPESPECD
jgi:hypothetical protein